MPIISITPLLGSAVGDIDLAGHFLYLSGGPIVTDDLSFISADGAGNLTLSGISIVIPPIASTLNLSGNSLENVSELALQSGGDILFGDSTSQSTAYIP